MRDHLNWLKPVPEASWRSLDDPSSARRMVRIDTRWLWPDCRGKELH